MKQAPDPTTVPGALHDIDFMVRDSKRFPDTGNWGYAQFNYGVRDLQAARHRQRMRLRLPYQGQSQGLRVHRLRQAVRAVRRRNRRVG